MKRYAPFILLLAIFLGGVIYFNYSKVVDPVAYHKAEMRVAWVEARDVSRPSVIEDFFHNEDDLSPGERYLFHLEELVLSGAYIKKVYVLENIEIGSSEGNHLYGLIHGKMCPPVEQYNLNIKQKSMPFRITLWFEKEHLEEWNQFMIEHDVTDFEEKFMDSAPLHNGDGQSSESKPTSAAFATLKSAPVETPSPFPSPELKSEPDPDTPD